MATHSKVVDDELVIAASDDQLTSSCPEAAELVGSSKESADLPKPGETIRDARKAIERLRLGGENGDSDRELLRRWTAAIDSLAVELAAIWDSADGRRVVAVLKNIALYERSPEERQRSAAEQALEKTVDDISLIELWGVRAKKYPGPEPGFGLHTIEEYAEWPRLVKTGEKSRTVARKIVKRKCPTLAGEQEVIEAKQFEHQAKAWLARQPGG